MANIKKAMAIIEKYARIAADGEVIGALELLSNEHETLKDTGDINAAYTRMDAYRYACERVGGKKGRLAARIMEETARDIAEAWDRPEEKRAASQPS